MDRCSWCHVSAITVWNILMYIEPLCHYHSIFYTWWANAFSASTLLVGRQEGHPACKKTEWLGAGMVVCLERGADLHMAQLMPLTLTVASVKSRLVSHFWYWLTWVVPDEGPLNGCCSVHVWWSRKHCTPNSWPWFCQILTDFHNSFTGRFSSKFAV